MNSRVGPSNTQPLRSSAMNAYGSQTSRQMPRLQNTQKSGLGNALGAGWGMGLQGVGFGASNLTSNTSMAGQSRPGQLSGFAQVMGGSIGQTPIDMSDFPSLSGPRQAANNSSVNWTPGTVRPGSTNQQPHAQHVSQPQMSQGIGQQQRAPSTAPSQQSMEHFDSQRSLGVTERSVGGDEFPPLGGPLTGDTAQNSGNGDDISSPIAGASGTDGQQTQLPIREANNYRDTTDGPIPSSQAQRPPQNGLLPVSGGNKTYSEMTEVEKWTLPGLMAAFEARRITDAGGQFEDTLPASLRNAVFFGQDLTNLGLDLDSPDPLCSSFVPFPSMNNATSQFDFHDRHTVPDFTLPPAYTVANVPPLSSRLNAFSDETLFAVFYQYPRDILQELAAMELTARDWRWHKVLRQWLQKDSRDSNAGSSLPIVDLASGAPVGTPPVRMGERTERGVYIFFDAMNWRRERREFILDYQQLDHRHAAQVPNTPAAAATAAATGLAAPGPGFPGGVTSSNNIVAIPQQASNSN